MVFDAFKDAAKLARDTVYQQAGGEIDETTGAAKGGRTGVMAGVEDTLYETTGGTVDRGSTRTVPAQQAASEAVATAGSATPAQRTGFPTGNFKIRNEQSGQCVAGFLGTQSDTTGALDKHGRPGAPNPEAGRYVQAIVLEPCGASRNQVWRYNTTTKRLENVGLKGRIATIGPNLGGGLLLSGDEVVDQEDEQTQEQETGPAWGVHMEGKDTTSSVQNLRFHTEDGYIRLVDASYKEETYWTAGKHGGIDGMEKGHPGQRWTFVKAT